MAKSKLIAKKNKMINLKLVMERLQRSFSLGKRLSMADIDDIQDQHDHDHEEAFFEDSSSVPEDVKEGHFAVVAVEDGGAAKRFVVPLRYLTHPRFVALLEKAAEEYGFEHDGALTIPCRPSEMEKILAQRWEGSRVNRPTGSSRRANVCTGNPNFMLQSYKLG